MDKLDPLGESCLAQFHIWTKKQAVLGEISSCWIGPVKGEDVRHTSAKLS